VAELAAPRTRTTRAGPSLTAVDIDATAAYALGPDAARWLAGRGHQAALVVHNDGTTTSIGHD
jgi:FAD:protein FMN transferase